MSKRKASNLSFSRDLSTTKFRIIDSSIQALDTSCLNQSMLKFPNRILLDKISKDFPITDLLKLSKSSCKLTKPTKNNQRLKLRQVSQWMQERLKQLKKEKVSFEQLVEYRQSILNIGLGQILKIYKEEFTEKGELLERIILSTLDFANLVLEYYQKNYGKLDYKAQLEINDLHTSYQDFILDLQDKLKKSEGRTDYMEGLFTQVIRNNRVMKRDLQKMEFQLKNQKSKSQMYSQIFAKLIEENIYLSLELGRPTQQLKERFKSLKKMLKRRKQDKNSRKKQIMQKVQKELKYVLKQTWKLYELGQSIDLDVFQTDQTDSPQHIKFNQLKHNKEVKQSIFQNFGSVDVSLNTENPVYVQSWAMAVVKAADQQTQNYAYSTQYFEKLKNVSSQCQHVQKLDRGTTVEKELIQSKNQKKPVAPSFIKKKGDKKKNQSKTQSKIKDSKQEVDQSEAGQYNSTLITNPPSRQLKQKQTALKQTNPFEQKNNSYQSDPRSKQKAESLIDQLEQTPKSNKHSALERHQMQDSVVQTQSHFQPNNQQQKFFFKINSLSDIPINQREDQSYIQFKDTHSQNKIFIKKSQGQAYLDSFKFNPQPTKQEIKGQLKASSQKKSEIKPKIFENERRASKLSDSKSFKTNEFQRKNTMKKLSKIMESNKSQLSQSNKFMKSQSSPFKIQRRLSQIMEEEEDTGFQQPTWYKQLQLVKFDQYYKSMEKKLSAEQLTKLRQFIRLREQKEHLFKNKHSVPLNKEKRGESFMQVFQNKRQIELKNQIKNVNVPIVHQLDYLRKMKQLVNSFMPSESAIQQAVNSQPMLKKAVLSIIKYCKQIIIDLARNFKKQTNKVIYSLGTLVYDKFMSRYGLKQVAQKKLEKLLIYAVISQNKSSQGELLSRILGCHKDSTSQDMAIYIKAICNLDASKQLRNSKEINLNSLFVKSASFVQNCVTTFDGLFSQNDLKSVQAKLFSTGVQQCVLDTVVLALLRNYSAKCQQMRNSLIDFQQPIITLTDFIRILIRLNFPKEREIVLVKNFHQFCDTRLELNRVMTKQRFEAFCFVNDIPTIKDLVSKLLQGYSLTSPWTIQQLKANQLQSQLLKKIKSESEVMSTLWRAVGTRQIIQRRLAPMIISFLPPLFYEIQKAHSHFNNA